MTTLGAMMLSVSSVVCLMVGVLAVLTHAAPTTLSTSLIRAQQDAILARGTFINHVIAFHCHTP